MRDLRRWALDELGVAREDLHAAAYWKAGLDSTAVDAVHLDRYGKEVERGADVSDPDTRERVELGSRGEPPPPYRVEASGGSDREGPAVRNRFGWGAAAVLALVLTGCTQTTSGQPLPAAPSAGGPSGTKAATTSAAPASSSPPSTDGIRATIATMTVTLPAGVRYAGESSEPGYEGCLQSASYACEGKILDLRAAADQGMINLPSAKRQFGWYPGTDVPTCIGPASNPGEASEATGSALLESGFAQVGTKTAEYARFQETCEQKTENNQVRMWWLPLSKILIVEHACYPELDAAFDRMVASATFG
ncbi:MAG TPA: hypothetical protein VHC18_07695 [Amycolatopsis sp.]|nr:hypothetical protein [Amycolatopsis sp.]